MRPNKLEFLFAHAAVLQLFVFVLVADLIIIAFHFLSALVKLSRLFQYFLLIIYLILL